MRRAGCAVLALLVVFVLFAAVVVALVGGALGGSAASIAALVIGFLAIIVLIGGGRRLRAAAEPIADLVEGAGRIEAGDYAARVGEAGPSEVRSLARAFNAMSARLEASEDARRRFLADVSHELRTPLTVMQGNLEGMIDGLYPTDEAHLRLILDETSVLERLVEDLRTLSVSEAGALRLHREPTSIAGLIADVVAAHAAAADGAGIRLVADAAVETGELDLDPTRMREVLGNLVGNALRHTPAGGSVTLTAARDDAHVTIAVTDTGRGMDAEQQARMFDRFFRDHESPGSGLGLAIVKNLVRAHGGEVGALSQTGAGTTVTVRLPVG
jgi:two-component system sensor histidine kinase BaeS